MVYSDKAVLKLSAKLVAQGSEPDTGNFSGAATGFGQSGYGAPSAGQPGIFGGGVFGGLPSGLAGGVAPGSISFADAMAQSDAQAKEALAQGLPPETYGGGISPLADVADPATRSQMMQAVFAQQSQAIDANPDLNFMEKTFQKARLANEAYGTIPGALKAAYTAMGFPIGKPMAAASLTAALSGNLTGSVGGIGTTEGTREQLQQVGSAYEQFSDQQAANALAEQLTGMQQRAGRDGDLGASGIMATLKRGGRDLADMTQGGGIPQWWSDYVRQRGTTAEELLAGADQTTQPAQTGLTPVDPTQAGLAPTAPTAPTAQPNPLADVVAGAYQQEFGYAPDFEGGRYWQQQMADPKSGVTAATLPLNLREAAKNYDTTLFGDQRVSVPKRNLLQQLALGGQSA